MFSLTLIGLNHRTADLEVREKAAFPAPSLPDALRTLMTLPGIHEGMILSTCNRVEILTTASDPREGLDIVEGFLRENSGISEENLKKSIYRYSDAAAIRHLFRVACSLDSMILGEPQILGQVKDSYNTAVEARTVGVWLNTVVQAAFKSAKRVRTETSIGEYSVSASSAAVELARKILGELEDKSILIVGAGKMGELAARHLSSSGIATIRVTNRSPQAAEELAARFQGQAVPYEELAKWILRSDIVIVSTGAPTAVVTRSLVEGVMRERRHSPLVLVDLSVPRNIEPAAGSLDNVFCYDIDDLGAVVEASLQERRRAAQLAEKILEQELEVVWYRLKSLDVAPVVVQLQSRIDEICRAELARFLRKSGPRDSREIQELESMIKRIAGKIAHPLISQLRSNTQDPAHREAYITTLKRIFGNNPGDSD
jgi:glutamyl-tRNA reductase